MKPLKEYFKFSHTERKVYSLEEYKDWCKENPLVADEAFQANSVFKNKLGGTGRWSNKDGESYIFNLIRGKAPTSFILSDNKACYDNAIRDGRSEDAEYFKEWGVSHMVLDSYNRNETLGTVNINDKKIIIGFFKDKIKLKCGVYEVYGKDGDPLTGKGKQSVEIQSGNDVYSKLPKLMREHIKYHVKIKLEIYTNLTQEECSEICRDVNLGVQWTTELFRNTMTSYVAGSVRKLPKKYMNLLLEEGCKWFTNDNLSKRKADAFFAQLYWMYNNDWTKNASGPGKLDVMYEIGKLSEKEVKAISTCVDYFFDDIIIKTKDERFGAVQYLAFENVILILHLFHMFVPHYKNGYRVLDKDLIPMFENFMQAHTDLYKSTDLYPKRKSGTWVKEPYAKLITGMQKFNANLCNELLSKKFDILNYLTKKGPRVVSDSAKTVIAWNQGMKTPEGKHIPADKLHTKKFNKGHGKKTYKETLTSDFDDTYIQTETDNKKQQSKPINL